MTERHEQPPAFDAVQPFAWSSEESVAYEAAVEAVNGAVAAYSARIAAEEAGERPDREKIARWRAARAECARSREGLDPTDGVAIAAARQRYTALREAVRGEGH
jgi:hypothetical protein